MTSSSFQYYKKDSLMPHDIVISLIPQYYLIDTQPKWGCPVHHDTLIVGGGDERWRERSSHSDQYLGGNFTAYRDQLAESRLFSGANRSRAPDKSLSPCLPRVPSGGEESGFGSVGAVGEEGETRTVVKFLKPNKAVIVLQGRFAGRKAVIVRAFDDGTRDRAYAHCFVAGIAKYSKNVIRKDSAKKTDKKSRVKAFLNLVKNSHIMPTRYTLDVDLKDAVTLVSLQSRDKKVATYLQGDQGSPRGALRDRQEPVVLYEAQVLIV
ncbi:hypothetical protein C4D60_Mb01t00870 [Musa balbisiana]|uniref:KOW domain-containing protein n=1 Tax=Musa balbisiana TaxID=52838 RepID=A0A4S8JJ66_MUSBA|nr:hypothetical protein C4D60_Mb01t00870 [Musa balbisiana]